MSGAHVFAVQLPRDIQPQSWLKDCMLILCCNMYLITFLYLLHAAHGDWSSPYFHYCLFLLLVFLGSKVSWERMKSLTTSVCILLIFVFILRMSLGMFQTAGLKDCTSNLYISTIFYTFNTFTTLALYSTYCSCLIESPYFNYCGPCCYLCRISVHFWFNERTNLQTLYSCQFVAHIISPLWCVCWPVCVFFLQGERLRIPPNKCCPECISLSQGSCQHEGLIYGVSENALQLILVNMYTQRHCLCIFRSSLFVFLCSLHVQLLC